MIRGYCGMAYSKQTKNAKSYFVLVSKSRTNSYAYTLFKRIKERNKNFEKFYSVSVYFFTISSSAEILNGLER